MITAEQLATLVVRQVIFHDVPQKKDGQKPSLSDVPTKISPEQKTLLKKKLVDSIGATKARPVLFLPPDETSSPVPVEVTTLTKNAKGISGFVKSSKALAIHLFEAHVGAVSPGLLCVMDVVSEHDLGIVLLKLERHPGARLKMSGQNGSKTFDMEVFDDLILGNGTRLFKSAMFLRSSKDKDNVNFTSAVFDDQSSVTSSDGIAKFWMRFLGCGPIADPRLSTKQFFEATVTYINTYVTDPIDKSDFYNALYSEMKSNEDLFVPQDFIDARVSPDYQNQFIGYLTEANIPLVAFEKNTQDIRNKLRRRVFITESGIMVSVPENQLEFVEVDEESITVMESVSRVGNK